MAYAFDIDPFELFDPETARRAAAAARSEVAGLPDRIWQAAPLSVLGTKLAGSCGKALAGLDLGEKTIGVAQYALYDRFNRRSHIL